MANQREGEPIGRREREAMAFSPLDRALGRVRWILAWERLWPPLAAVVTAIGLFLALSWLGLWLALPPLGRAVGLFGFFVIAVAATLPLIRLRWPTRQDALRRLDQVSGLRHRPATTIADGLAVSAGDPVSSTLWQIHIERALRAASRLRAGRPAPRLALRDPLALRALVLVTVVATYFAAGDDRMRRIAAAFDWHGVVAPADFRVDAWVDPPAYTGRPPIILPVLHAAEARQARSASLAVPVGSVLVVRATGVSLDIAATGGVVEGQPQDAVATPIATQPGPGSHERRFTVKDGGTVVMRGLGGPDVVWTFAAIADRPPTIALADDPERQLRGAMELAYEIEDDYGVVDGRATFRRTEVDTGAKKARPLFGPPEIQLVLPQARTRKGAGKMIKDLTDHPWAGVGVAMTLEARDEAGNVGRSEPFEFRLPERPFSKPVARALVEQRRVLALDAEAYDRVLTALDTLALAPEKFDVDTKVYLGLRSVFWMLARARGDDDLRAVADRLWSMALSIEDGDLGEAEQALRAAQEALRQALERGATDEEIRRLTEQLREALNRFMQALAEQMRQNPQQMARPLDPNSQMIRPQDLNSMIDRLEELARSGAKDAARRLLQELQQMLENLQTARPGNSFEMDQGDDMMSALDQLGEMIYRQQQLRDRTFRQGQDMRRGQPGDQDQMRELQENQQALEEQLRRLLDELRQNGFGQGDDNQGELDQLGRAGDAMGDAAGQLGKGDADSAVGSQGRALDALRRGAQNLAQAMQNQGFGPGPGPGDPSGRLGRSRANSDTDPLGRPLRGRDYGDDTTVKVPGEIDVQRARRILEELRRRFGETFRPQLELEYIERLLRDF